MSFLSERVRAQLRGDALVVMIGNGGALAVGMVTGVLAARVLEPTGRGHFFAIQTLVSVVAVIGALGVGQAVVTARVPLSQLRRALLMPPLLTGSAVTAGLWVAQERLSWLGPAGAVGGGALAAAGVLIAISAGLAQRRGDMRRGFQAVRLAPPATALVALAVLVLTSEPTVDLWLMCVGLGSLIPSILLFRPFKAELDSGSLPSPARDKAFMRIALGSLLIAAASQLLYRSDAIMVSALASAEAAGLYAVALTLPLAVTSLGQTGGMLAFSRLRSATESRDRLDVMNAGIRVATVITVSCGLVLGLASPLLIPLLFGADYVKAVAPTLILLVSATTSAIDHSVTHAAMAFGIRGIALRNQVVSIAITFPLLAIAVSYGTLVAVAAVSIVSTTVAACPTYLACRRAA